MNRAPIPRPPRVVPPNGIKVCEQAMFGIALQLYLVHPLKRRVRAPVLIEAPGAVPGVVNSMKGQGHMRVQRGAVFYSPRPLSVCVCSH